MNKFIKLPFIACGLALLLSAAEAPAAPFTPDGNMPRSRVPARFKWKLKPLFKADKAFEQALAEAVTLRGSLADYAGKLGQPRLLRACLERYFAARLLTNRLTLYASLRHDSHNRSAKLKAMSDRALAAMNALMGAAGFIRREVLALDDAAMARAYKVEAGLVRYRPYLDQLRRRRQRVLGPEAERVLSLVGDNLWAEIDLNELPSDHEKTFKALRSETPLPRLKDASGKEVQLTLSSLGRLRASPRRSVRRAAMEGFFAALKGLQHSYAAALAGQVRLNVTLARSRGYDTALEAYLDKDDIDPAVYRNLVASIRANLAPLHRYVRLRKKALGLDEVRVFDLYTPLARKVQVAFPFAAARRVLPAALAPLGPAYLKVLRRGLNPRNGWLDLYPSKGKNAGAFCASLYGQHPYVKMNYYGQLDDLSTLAHEYGHALHSHLSMKSQPYITAGYAPFVAEIASTVNEKLLSDHLLARAGSDAERLYILGELAEAIRTTIYRQALFAEFELRVHTAAEAGTPLTADLLNRTYAELIKAYYGPDFTMGKDDDVEWAYIPHFYYKYYMFTYATGLSAGIALAEKVQQGGAAARKAYLGMLRGGSSRPPLELLRGAGVDLTRPAAFKAAAALLDRTVARMEQLLPK